MSTLLLDKAGVSTRTAVRNIRDWYAVADAQTRDAGREWYPAALKVAHEIAGTADVPLDNAACVIAHLSPRKSWRHNVTAARQLAAGEPVTATMARELGKARLALHAPDPWSTFGRNARKTRAFAANILGDERTVTVDTWAMRAAGLHEDAVKLVGVYDAVAHAYRLAARRIGESPAVVQATTWIAIRGGRTE